MRHKLLKELEDKIREITKLENQLNEANSKIRGLYHEISVKDKEIENLKFELARLRKEFEESGKLVKYGSGKKYEYKFYLFNKDIVRLPEGAIILGITPFPAFEKKDKYTEFTIKCLVPIKEDDK